MRQKLLDHAQFSVLHLLKIALLCSTFSIFQMKASLAQSAPHDSDTIIIFDTSGSMNTGHVVGDRTLNRYDYAKEKLGQLMSKFQSGSSGHRVGLITFRNGPYLSRDLLSVNPDLNIGTFLSTLPEASSNTPLAASIRYAADMLAASPAKSKNLIIMSDGQNDSGIGEVYKAIQYYNSQALGAVHLHLFADSIGDSFAVWNEFRSLADIIFAGTLFLVVSGHSADSYGSVIDLTYNSIEGQWPSGLIFSRFQALTERISVHADHVVIVDNADSARMYRSRTSYRNSEIDWELLKRQQPQLYDTLTEGLASLEQNAAELRSISGINYLIARGVSSRLGSEYRVTLTDLSQELSATLDYLWEEAKTLESWRVSAASVDSSIIVPYASTVFTGLSSAFAADALQNTSLLLSASVTGTKQAPSNILPTGSDTIFQGNLSFLGGTISSFANGGFVAAGVLSGSWLGFNSMASVASDIQRSKNQLQVEHERELENFDKFVQVAESENLIQQLFPELSAEAVQDKVARLRVPNLSMESRVQILFDHNPDLQILAESLAEVQSVISELNPADNLTFNKYDGELPPRNVRAYVRSLIDLPDWSIDKSKLADQGASQALIDFLVEQLTAEKAARTALQSRAERLLADIYGE